MLRLLKINLRNYVFCKFTVIAVILLLGSTVLEFRPDSDVENYLVQYFVVYRTFIVCAAVLIKSERNKKSGSYRNMIVAGYKRWQVFTAHVIASAVYGAMLFFTEAVIACAATGSAAALLTCIAAYMFWSAVAACFSMLMDNVLTTMLAITAAAGFMFVISKPVTEPLYEMKYHYVCLDENGNEDTTKGKMTRIDNTEYISGAYRVALKTFTYLNPFSQMIYAQKAMDEAEGLENDVTDCEKDIHKTMMYELIFPLLSLGMMTAVCAAGCRSFSKKDLN